MDLYESHKEAVEAVALATDIPVKNCLENLGQGVTISSETIDLGSDNFTNLYVVSFLKDKVKPSIQSFDYLMSPSDFLKSKANLIHRIASSGGFFFLADVFSERPRELALNLSSSEGKIRSLPVVDREAVIVDRGRLTVRFLSALGALTLNDREFSWSGSRTDYDSDITIFGNGNSVIRHIGNTATGTIRVLDEESRYSPTIKTDDQLDIGFIGMGGSTFRPVTYSPYGGLDIFSHDFIARLKPEQIPKGNWTVDIKTVGGIATNRFFEGSFSAGPMLNIQDFDGNPINKDPSLGDNPPFGDRRMARIALFGTDDGYTRIALFDGRPNSKLFSGVTPREATEILFSLWTVEWGCFLDPGQTAKICTISDGELRSYGNRHYLEWPSDQNGYFKWAPDQGRKIANIIAL